MWLLPGTHAMARPFSGSSVPHVFQPRLSSCSVRTAISLTFFLPATQERLLLLLLQRLPAFHSLVYGLRLLLPLGSAAFSEAVNLLPLLLPSQVTFQPAGPKVDNSREAFDQAEEAAQRRLHRKHPALWLSSRTWATYLNRRQCLHKSQPLVCGPIKILIF